MAAAADTPRWKENQLKIFEVKDVIPVLSDWKTWTISTLAKMDAMDELWFPSASESLVFVDDEFHNIVAHQAIDNVTTIPFKKAVVTLAASHGYLSPVAADNTNPASDAHYARNYANIVKRLKAIHSQLSDSCGAAFETMFEEEQIANHPLKAMRVWMRMSDSIYKIQKKDRGMHMKDLQDQAGIIPSWDLDDLNDWVRITEQMRQDLLKSGHTVSVADDCIVCNLLEALTSVPASAPFFEDWKHDSRNWKSEHDKDGSLTWLVLKSRIKGNIKSFMQRTVRDEFRTDRDRPAKKAKATVPAGMSLQAMEARIKSLEDAPGGRTRFQK